MERLEKCPICGGKLTIYDWRHRLVKVSEELDKADIYDAQCDCGFSFILPKRPLKEFIEKLNTRKPLERYEELERKLQSVYGECDGLLEKVIEGLVKHEGAEFEKPMKARLLTDEDVDKWDRLKGAMERIVERLEKQVESYPYPRKKSYLHAIEIVKGEMENEK